MANGKEPRFLAIGIDFGSTYSSVGIWRDEKIHIVSNGHGNIKMPSYVAFTDGECLIGEEAFNQAAYNTSNTIFDIKRLLGMKFNDFSLRSGVEFWPLEFMTENKKTKIKVTHKGKRKSFSPEDICAMVLLKMKSIADEYLRDDVTNVVLTVPASFNDSQKQAIVEASRIAGMNIIRMLSDPIAAAIAYGLDQKGPGIHHALVFDLGGGTFDVSILCVEDGHFDLKATSGDSQLGGEDFDSRLLSHFVKEIRCTHGKDISENPSALRRLRNACEHAKRVLSSTYETRVRVDSLVDGVSLDAMLTRAQFEELCEDLFLLVFQHLENVLFVSNIQRNQIDDVVLVGGCTKMPKIQELVTSFFDREISQTVDPDEALVIGATMQAVALSVGDPVKCTVLSIGIEAPGSVMTVIIPRKTELPVKKTVNYTTYRDYQQVVTLKVYEGERLLAPRNTCLGTMSLEGIPLLPRGVPQIDISFEVKEDGELVVTAVERSSGQTGEMRAATSLGNLSSAQAEQLQHEAETLRGEDELERDRVVARDLLETCLLNVKHAMDAPDVLDSMTQEDHEWYVHWLGEEHQWLKQNPSADKAVYVRKTIDLQILYLSVVVDVFHDPGGIDNESRERRVG